MKHLHTLQLSQLLRTLLFLAASHSGVQAETISSANTTIVHPVNGTLKEQLAAKEVRRYVYLRCGQLLETEPVAELPALGDLIVVATSGSTLLESLRDAIGYEPTVGQTLIKAVAEDDRNILVVSGADADATLTAAYRYAERIGVGFDLAGKPIPDSANPSSVYDGAPLIRVLGIETKINKGEPLKLSLIALETGDTPPVLKIRSLGRGVWQEVPVDHKARRVYSAVIPPQADDFEYYLESGDTKFPVTAGSASPEGGWGRAQRAPRSRGWGLDARSSCRPQAPKCRSCS